MRVGARIGLKDHGLPISERQAESARFEDGYKYEIIDGRLYVSPQALEPENRLELWLFRKLLNFSDKHSDVINHVTNKARVFVPRRRQTTTPEPDVAAYSGYPLDTPLGQNKWEIVSPVLVAEVLYASDPYKDLVRNVDLYLRVPTIREYWILDARSSASKPILIVRRRNGRSWVKREYYYREKYTTKLLPGFSLLIDPRR
jgi:Uma2 family endonuclease